MRKLLVTLAMVSLTYGLFAQTPSSSAPSSSTAPKGHPNPSGIGWKSLFEHDLSDAGFPKGVWSIEDGVLTATADKAIWTAVPYDDFILDLFFKTADGTNSGVVVHASDTTNWIPNSVEIQIADDYAQKWAESPKTGNVALFSGIRHPQNSVL